MKIKGKSKDPKRTEADQKRILSMVEMKKEYNQKKSLIKHALSNVDFKPKNKIVFGDNENEEENENASLENKHATNGRTKNTLFDDEDDENDEEECNFKLKEYFEGDEGQKLMRLQSKFKNDKRFVMDERFLDDEENNVKSEPEEMTQEKEKEKQFEILNEVLGKVTGSSTVNNGFKESQKKKVMMRFDPTQPEHSKFEVKEQITEKKKQKRKNLIVEENEKKAEEFQKPVVSKDTFYQVATDLKTSLENKQQEFSLLSMFNRTQQEEADNEETGAQNETATLAKKKKLLPDSNPFKYDSSSDEDPDEQNKALEQPPTEIKTKAAPKENKTAHMFFSEKFFFKDDDYRLQEGLDFVKRIASAEESDFMQVRRNLKEIVRAKVRQNQRKNKPFKRKLGGRKKMIKIRKAMKR